MVVGLVLALAGPVLVVALAASGRTANAAGSWPLLSDGGTFIFALAGLATAVAAALLVVGWRAAVRGAFTRALVLAIPATALAEMALFGAWLPNARWIWNTPRIVGAVVADCGVSPEDPAFPRIAGVGYQEDSLLWTTRGRLDRFGDAVTDANRDALRDWCRANRGGYLLIPRASSGSFEDLARTVAGVEGFNYSDGDPVAHVLMRVE
jgi:hypothetical protein